MVKLSRRIEAGVVVALLSAYVVMGMSAAEDKSPGFDEPFHLAAGLAIWERGDHRLYNPGHLSQWYMAIPVSFMAVEFPSVDHPGWRRPLTEHVAYDLFYRLGNDVHSMLRAGRAMAATMGVALGLLVWWWSRSLFGVTAGLISLVLFAFSPTMLAHGFLITADLPLAFALLAATFCMARMIESATPASVAASAVAVGAALLTKSSGVLGVLIGLILAGRAVAKRQLSPQRFVALTGLHAVVAAVMIWGFYGFQYSAFRDMQPGRDAFRISWEQVLEFPGVPMRMIGFCREHRLLPESYLYSFAHYVEATSDRPAFMNGRVSKGGWATFYPFAFLIKTPAPTLMVILLAAAAGLRVPLRGVGRTWPLWTLIGVYAVAAVTSRINIGHRHLLPIYPAMFILCGAAAAWLDEVRWRRGAAVLLAAAMMGLVFASISIRPHYLSYFNVLVGGPRQGHRHLTDSSVDWGQDLPALKRYLDANTGGKSVYLSYFGFADPRYYGLSYQPLPSFFPLQEPPHIPTPYRPGVYCISATRLATTSMQFMGPWCVPYEREYQSLLEVVKRFTAAAAGTEERKTIVGQRDEGEWRELFERFEELRLGRLLALLRYRDPDGMVGYSILIYHLTDADVDRAQYGEPAELFDRITVEQR